MVSMCGPEPGSQQILEVMIGGLFSAILESIDGDFSLVMH